MRKRDRERISRLLQQAADCICVNVPDKLTLSFVDDEILFYIDTWGPALTRQSFEGAVGLEAANYTLGRQYADLSWTKVALMMVKANFLEYVTYQGPRHMRARALGLEHDGTYDDLPFHRMTIDRELFRLLDEAGVDVREAASAIGARKRSYGFFEVGHKQNGTMLIVTDGDADLPVISAWHWIGDTGFNGSELAIREQLPVVLALGVIGRPLGDLVDVGRPGLQARRIALVTAIEEPVYIHDAWLEYGTLITLEPDLVEVGIAVSGHVGASLRRPSSFSGQEE